ncbi:MAG TPA: DUF2877 domain-containing protein [Nocardioidaceae bacterium]|nr:DUF2877 domain-containing protein [Nocardioidaceae bacterium]
MTRTEVAAAAPAWVRERLGGPRREADVVHFGTDAVYLDDDGACLGLLTRSAVAVPCGLQTTLRDVPPAGRIAHIGGGHLEVSGVQVHVGRLVDASVPRLNACSTTPTVLADAYGDRLEDVRAELPASALSALRNAETTAVRSLLGRGSGLTPVGDDVLCGWTATRHGLGTPSVPVIRAIQAGARASTTRLSATLLDRACAGEVIPQFRQLLLALRAPTASAPAIGRAVDALLAVGHTSGAGLLLGATIAVSPQHP